METTYVGDAFVVFRADGAATNKPKASAEILNDSRYTVLCSYRLKKAVGREKYLHCVEYLADSSCSVTAASKGDDEYRITACIPKQLGYACRLPPPTESWEFTYEYMCPPVPSSSTWNSTNQTIYVWGDLDFDFYGASHLKNVTNEHIRSVHPCSMNQIVPQVMMGHCLSSNDDKYVPSWKSFDNWVIQAQYFWMDENEDPRALCGPLIDAREGDVIRTKISYDAHTGCITAKICIMLVTKDGKKKEDPKKKSHIKAPRPFPHDPSLFRDWKDFFERCVDAERAADLEAATCTIRNPLERAFAACCGGKESPKKGVFRVPARGSLRGTACKEAVDSGEISDVQAAGPLARPYLNVEYKGKVGIDTLRSICPFVVTEATYPGMTPGPVATNWKAHLYCPRTGFGDALSEERKGGEILRLSDALVLSKQ